MTESEIDAVYAAYANACRSAVRAGCYNTTADANEECPRGEYAQHVETAATATWDVYVTACAKQVT